MSNKTIQKIAGISTLVCGTLHTTAHIVMSSLPSPNPEIQLAMESVKINLINEKTLFDYHNGMSLAMGILVIGLAFQIFLMQTKLQLILNLTCAGIVSVIAIVYFHPIAMGLMIISTLFLTLKLIRYDA